MNNEISDVHNLKTSELFLRLKRSFIYYSVTVNAINSHFRDLRCLLSENSDVLYCGVFFFFE